MNGIHKLCCSVCGSSAPVAPQAGLQLQGSARGWLDLSPWQSRVVGRECFMKMLSSLLNEVFDWVLVLHNQSSVMTCVEAGLPLSDPIRGGSHTAIMRRLTINPKEMLPNGRSLCTPFPAR